MKITEIVSITEALEDEDERKKRHLGMINAYLKSGKNPAPDSPIYNLMKRYGFIESTGDETAREPTAQEIDQVEDLIGSIDPSVEEPQSIVAKLNSWIKQYPLLDKITDLIPQTRIVKAVAQAVDALEQGNGQAALNSIASVAGGGLAQAARAVNVGTALQQGDAMGAALAAGGGLGKVAKGVNTAQRVSNFVQNDELDRVKKLAGI
jgi:hypothetical protein